MANANGRASTGVAGLDDIFSGGLPPGRLFLFEGEPGTAKTTLAACSFFSPASARARKSCM